ncbi:DUF3014 domain-containing protein [Rheinheimera maricola]|uniref:DUF3014 domain-containing protein n=1 Tax=Rheinheimera maricola TaxID=2793282 RepID=A0ABS7XB96_9GAMM|nr:DUF3014 domain-containing protein [Rheinheimera maricola]MBZ9612817.1 DUF3014 domain-containing protein [Rheinheimera maricola]
MSEQKSNNNQQLYYAGIAVVGLVVLIALWFLLGKAPQQEPVKPTAPVIVAEPVETHVAALPAETALATEPPELQTTATPSEEIAELVVAEPALPVLDESDPEVKQRLLALDWRAGLAGLFVTEDMLRNFAVQIDNIAQGQLAAAHPLLQPLEQTFRAADADDMQLDSRSFSRYQPYIQLLESVPPQQLVQLFNRYEPLLQQSYAEQGYPDQLFKNTLIAAIDLLLATPEVDYPLALARPSVVYIFADPAIEQLPAAQKQMIRLGPDNQRKVKALLQRYRAALLATP